MAPLPQGDRKVTTTHQAIEKSGMTLDELGIFVQEAMRVGHAGNADVKVNATMRRGVRALEVTSTIGGQARPS